MFVFCALPFSTSDTLFFNGEVYSIILNIQQSEQISASVLEKISFVLTIDTDNRIIL